MVNEKQSSPDSAKRPSANQSNLATVKPLAGPQFEDVAGVASAPAPTVSVALPLQPFCRINIPHRQVPLQHPGARAYNKSKREGSRRY